MAFGDEAVALMGGCFFYMQTFRRDRGYERVLKYGAACVYRDWRMAWVFPGRV